MLSSAKITALNCNANGLTSVSLALRREYDEIDSREVVGEGEHEWFKEAAFEAVKKCFEVEHATLSNCTFNTARVTDARTGPFEWELECHVQVTIGGRAFPGRAQHREPNRSFLNAVVDAFVNHERR